MTEPEIFRRLAALRVALTEKLGRAPFIRPALRFGGSSCTVSIYPAYTPGGTDPLHVATAHTAAEALDEADAFVAAMPDPEARNRLGIRSDLDAVIARAAAAGAPMEAIARMRGAADLIG